jgi:heterogeneous nuclear rnp K-like protein 2
MAQEPTYDIASFTGLLNNPDTLTVSEQNEVPATTTTDTAKKPENTDSNFLSLRSLVTIRDAGVIIGKGGKNVTEVREITGVKAAVSKVVTGVNERILTVTGNLDSVAKAYSSFANYLLENASVPCTNIYSNQFNFLNHFTNNNHNNNNNGTNDPVTAIHLLINHLLLGSVIGKNGVKIKEIREASGARIIASKEMLPQSTERVIDIIGTVDAIHIAVHKIGECILNDTEKTYCIQYTPTLRNNISTVYNQYRAFEQQQQQHNNNNANHDSHYHDNHSSNGNSNFNDKRKNGNNKSKADLDVRKINFPADMVGCIIGKGGKKITEIRNVSGSKINISPIDASKNGSKVREFTITGTPENIDKALQLIYEQLEAEKQRRLNLEKKAQNENTDTSAPANNEPASTA